jgi:hypothetical protein
MTLKRFLLHFNCLKILEASTCWSHMAYSGLYRDSFVFTVKNYHVEQHEIKIKQYMLFLSKRLWIRTYNRVGNEDILSLFTACVKQSRNWLISQHSRRRALGTLLDSQNFCENYKFGKGKQNKNFLFFSCLLLFFFYYGSYTTEFPFYCRVSERIPYKRTSWG